MYQNITSKEQAAETVTLLRSEVSRLFEFSGDIWGSLKGDERRVTGDKRLKKSDR
jgi:hypothetical protein